MLPYKIHWKIDDDGYVCTHRNIRIFLDCISKRDLFSLLQEAWDSHIADRVSSRKGFVDWPIIDSVYTKTLASPDNARDDALLSVLTSLGTMYNQQADHWADDDDEEIVNCPLCDQPNDRVHFSSSM